MCGICGKIIFDDSSIVDASLIASMMDTIRHRGPDDEGVYFDSQIGLGHRRLSIIDLQTGHQPLSNEDGSVWIVFNGEIYNHQELINTLKTRGHIFKTKSDTEVIVHLYEEYSESCIEQLRGMFAFAIWDRNKKRLILARDRVGIKPLYYWKSSNSLVFASEIKAILEDPSVTREINFNMIDRFLSFFFMPGEETILRGIYKLLPGHYLVCQNGKIDIHEYWDLKFSEDQMSLREAEIRFLELLDETLRLHMISDVPVGFLLSGGIDSTAMLAFAAGKSIFPLSSYTLGFSKAVIADERPYAKLAAERYGSEHHEMTITSKEFIEFMPKYVWHMEEPVCEPQAVALYYVSKMASHYVKVLISGEGGDEAFGGYTIYRNINWLEHLKKIFGPMNKIIKKSLIEINHLFKSQKVGKYAPLLDIPFDSYYFSRTSNPFRFFNSHIQDIYTKDFLLQINKNYSLGNIKKYFEKGNRNSFVNRMLYIDTKTSLPDDLLLKADKMTMANSLELRVPFLDHKLLEFAASLPSNYKVRGINTKYLPKKALKNQLPNAILRRRKAGFPVPYESWLQTELSSWVDDILLDSRTLNRGYFKRSCIEYIINENKRLKGALSKEVLSLIILELWHRAFIDK
ncbi:asparagine synthase (glutamine-hydrolyzing) [Candidatus Bathyarchaeota archaeon]|nr:asparagine synthase (glutamine-hydrolyzing) [Candidatus Bathyarchaeota archaeon]